MTNNPITESGDVSPSEEGSDTENSTEEAPVTEQDASKQESNSKLKIGESMFICYLLVHQIDFIH